MSPLARILGLLLATALVAGAVVATATWAGGSGEPRVLTYQSYFEAGERQMTDHLVVSKDGRESALLDRIARARDAVVRIRVHHARSGSSFSTSHGSGFVLKGGRHVVTAAHVLAALDSHDDAEIVVAFPDGSLSAASCVQRPTRLGAGENDDWAVLELAEARLDDAGVTVRAGGDASGPVAVLGFPEQLGLTEDGRVAKDAIDEGFVLRALAVVARPDGPGELSVTAGAVPLGGISGGPVIDTAGHVVAIDTAIRSHRDAEGAVTWRIVVASVDGLHMWLREHAPQSISPSD